MGRNTIMQITDIKVRKLFDEGPMKAIASVTFDDCLAVHDVKVIYARDRYFIVMPSRKNPDGTYRDMPYPDFPPVYKAPGLKELVEQLQSAANVAQTPCLRYAFDVFVTNQQGGE